MQWGNILDGIRELKSEPAGGNPGPAEEEPKADAQAEVPQHQWYQIGDWFSRTDELLEKILLQLMEMGTVPPVAVPAPLPPPVPIPPGVEPKLDVIAAEQIRTKELLEGFSFVTNQGVVSAPGTPLEMLSGTKTYLIMVRANATNAADVYVGGQGVTAGTGYVLGPGDAAAVPINAQRKRVFIDAAAAGDGVSWLALVD